MAGPILYKKGLFGGAEAPFPVVEGASSGQITTNSNSHAITLPADIEAGELLLVFYTTDGQPTLTATGWSNIDIVTSPGVTGNLTPCTMGCFYKTAAGSDSLTIGLSANEQSSWIAYRVSGWANVSGESDYGFSTNAQPPAISLESSKNTLYFVACGYDAKVIATAAPSGYDNLTTLQHNNNDGASTSAAYKSEKSDADTPGAFTSNQDQWVAFTVAITP